uniref:Reverse transcriptase domain-containing protein n=1 Tax=Fagus sylvatica TaxID=28930 RepID=A0A2N9HCI6_FAGSY
MKAFRDVLDDCGLVDLGFTGFPFTWCNNRDPPNTTWLGSWSRDSFGNISKKIEATKLELKQAETRAIQGDSHENLQILRQRLNSLFEKEEKMWRQRSRSLWLANGDRNTKYSTVEQHSAVDGTISMAEVVAQVPQVVTEDMNKALIREFTAPEVELALNQMAPTKAPGPDGRLITDNVLVAFETLHYMHHNRVGRDGAMALKLDMSKAYDRVEWHFLEKIMTQLGFHHKWISLITECISTVSYSILVNGEPHGYIQPSRGLRQGDPLSPYLFLLCAEGLHSLIQKAKMDGDIQGISLCRRGPKITHLFFADDSLLFSKATANACEKIQGILAQYENASGQQVNRDKTTIYFSKHTPEASQHVIKEALGVPIIRQYEKYLGLPSLVGRNRTESFTKIKERVWQKLKGWKEKLLSQAGREILIKAVAQAIPTYSMSCFRLPAKRSELEAMVRRFWWSNNPEQRKIHWVAWRKLCKPKQMGGMGFRDLRKFNEALLAKQVWRLTHDTSSLFYRVFKAKFFPHGTILDCPSSTRGSYAWQSILKARDVISRGAVWRVGNGASINIWDHRWLLEENHRKIITPAPNILLHCTVNQLIVKPQMEWDHSLIDRLFFPHDAVAIKHTPLSNQEHPDTLTWPGNTNGEYSVRSGYRFLVDEEDKCLPATCEALPTKLNLHKRRIPVDPTCELCGECNEDAIHALWSCNQLQIVWEKESWLQSIRSTPFVDFADLLTKEVDPINQVGQKAKCYLEKYLNATDQRKPQAQPAPIARWMPPRMLRYKVNYDGVVFKDTNEAGIGIIVRDSSGLVMASLVQKVLFPHSIPRQAWAARINPICLEIGLPEQSLKVIPK